MKLVRFRFLVGFHVFNSKKILLEGFVVVDGMTKCIVQHGRSIEKVLS
ncbi:hypothetical protein HanXRQr2_Chr01g0032611 [Helianthus annuus]|uniref:Uncharacterized protein n=1 Tax=Helianthus annuus TaxID=4232 RepID=A0A9K3JWB8_HELAN|nr:hypothetical protein HanXRQr2_Chr01g0032611 [Helianthus annuus]KAJ0957797.1 hypothetical protein HanPSC8_Chr01g0031801 [Helianthus annuus]